VDEKEVFEQLKKCNSPDKASYGLNGHRASSIIVAVLLVFAVLLSASSGVYAGASFFPQDVTVTTTVYSTTTSWTTSTIWSTLTSTVYGVWTTVVNTTSTSTVTVTAGTSTSSSTTTTTSSTRVGTSLTLSAVTASSGKIAVTGYLRDANGNGLAGMQVRITVDGGYAGITTTTSSGSFSYSGLGPTIKGQHILSVSFSGTTQYASSSATRSYTI